MGEKELEYPAINWLSAIALILFTIPMIIMVISLILSALRKPLNIVLVLSIIVNISYLATTILICVNEFVYLLLDNWKLADANTAASSISLYWTSQVFMISSFISRINQLLSTKYDTHLSKVTIRLLYTCVIIMIVCDISTFIMIFAELIINLWLFLIPAFIFVILYFCLTIVCLVIFIGKVNKVLVSINESYRKNEKIDEDKRDNAIKHIIRHSVLISVAIISSFLLDVIYVVISSVLPNVTGSDRDESGLFWLSIDCLISSACVYLLFAFDINNRIYDKLCSKLHNKCHSYKFRRLKLSETGVNLHNISSPIYDDDHINETKDQTNTVNDQMTEQ